MIALHKNPPMLNPAGVAIADVAEPWWVAHTRSRHEKALAGELVNVGITYFLPMVQRTLIIKRRRFRGLHPVFPGYLFFAGDVEARCRVGGTMHVANVLRVVDQSKLADELTQIHKALRAPAGFDPFPFLRAGTRCRIKAGALQGVQGTVVQRDGVTRLVLQVEMLGQAVSTEVDPSVVEVME